METDSTSRNFEIDLAVAAIAEGAAITEELSRHTGNILELGPFVLARCIEIDCSDVIAELGQDLLTLMNKDTRETMRDDSAKRFNYWEATGWVTGTKILLKHSVVPENRQDEFLSYLTTELFEMSPKENEHTESVNERLSDEEESADAGIMSSVFVIRNSCDIIVGNDSLVDVNAFKRGLYYAFVAGQKFTETEPIDIDAEFEDIEAPES